MPVKTSHKKGSPALSNLRGEIDLIDREILESINKRASLAFKVMEAKREISKGVYDPEREREVERKIVRLNRGPLTDADAVSIFREVIRSCRALQSVGRVSYLGPEGSFSHLAASNMSEPNSALVPRKTLEDVFESILTDSVSKGVVPIENSTEGPVGGVLEIIAGNDLRITAEHFEGISHFLLSNASELQNIKKVASHPQALGQCRKWLSSELPSVGLVETSSTAAAAAMAAEDSTVAAISSAFSASIYKLRVVAGNIEDNPINSTRFVTVEKSSVPMEKGYGNKVSLVFCIKDEPGSLHKTFFSPLASAGVNLTRIESRPSGKKPWEYMFFVDFEGSMGQPETDALIEKIEAGSSSFKVLGCYFSGNERERTP